MNEKLLFLNLALHHCYIQRVYGGPGSGQRILLLLVVVWGGGGGGC